MSTSANWYCGLCGSMSYPFHNIGCSALSAPQAAPDDKQQPILGTLPVAGQDSQRGHLGGGGAADVEHPDGSDAPIRAAWACNRCGGWNGLPGGYTRRGWSCAGSSGTWPGSLR
jgi:hypothetical protein